MVSIGNLTVGGTGKTPLSAWIASFFAESGLTPAVVLRGYGGDEARIHRALAPGAKVIESPDRLAGIRRALRKGAEVVVLDDGFQRLDVARDLDVVVVSAESRRAAPWTLPAGPWREPLSGLARADFMVVTRRCAPPEEAASVLEKGAAFLGRERVAQAQLAISRLEPIGGGSWLDPRELAGKRVLAMCGIGDPVSFRAQLANFEARVELVARRDHYAYGPRDVRLISATAAQFDYVVVTLKDSWKLARYSEKLKEKVLVAHQEIRWESGFDYFRQCLECIVALAGKRESRVSKL